jgi:hypothetical protein
MDMSKSMYCANNAMEVLSIEQPKRKGNRTSSNQIPGWRPFQTWIRNPGHWDLAIDNRWGPAGPDVKWKFDVSKKQYTYGDGAFASFVFCLGGSPSQPVRARQSRHTFAPTKRYRGGEGPEGKMASNPYRLHHYGANYPREYNYGNNHNNEERR